MSKIKAGLDRLLVKQFKEESEKGGIIIPDSVQKELQKGMVVDCGESTNPDLGEFKIPKMFPIGTVVYFDRSFTTNKFKYGEEELISLKHSDVIAYEIEN